MKIPEIHHEAILAKAAEGLSTRAIATWLAAEHGVVTTHASVGKLLRDIRSEREPVKQAVIAEKTAKSVGRDLDILQELQTELDRKRKGLSKKPKRLRDYLAVVGQLQSVTSDKLKAAGAGGDRGGSDIDAKTRLLEKLTRLAGE
jgi:hypothetical protein